MNKLSKNIFGSFGLVIRQLVQTLQFVVLLFYYLLSQIWQKMPIKLPSRTKNPAKMNRILAVLDPTKTGEISRLSLIELSIRNLLAKKNRTTITVGGMALGIAAIVFLVSIGYGLQQVVISRVASLDELKQADVTTQIGSKIKINDQSLNAFKQIPNVTDVQPIISVVGTLNYQNSVSDIVVYGVQSNYLQHASLQLLNGKYFTNNDLASLAVPPTVLGASTTANLFDSLPIVAQPPAMGVTIAHLEFTLPNSSWVRVRQNPDANSPIIGYTKQAGTSQIGDEVWGSSYASANGLGKAATTTAGKSLGKWVKATVLLWQKQSCDPKTQGDCEAGGYLVMRDSAHDQVSQVGYVAAANVILTGTSLASGQVLGVTTSAAAVQPVTQTGSIPFVQIASLSAQLNAPNISVVPLGSNAVKQAVVNVATLNILGIKANEAIGKNFQTTFTTTGGLLDDPSQKLQSQPATYTIVAVIAGDKTPLAYVPFIDLRSMGLTNYSQARVLVNAKTQLNQVRKQIESQGFLTQSVADTVTQINGLFATATTVLWLLGFVALVVASLGMFNTLTVSLLERTREVGLMKAMGMKSEEVSELFLTESMTMSFFGGFLGLLLGFAAGKLLSLLLSIFSLTKGVGVIDISFLPLPFIIAILGLSLLVGLVTGIYPARRSTKISALNALRYE